MPYTKKSFYRRSSSINSLLIFDFSLKNVTNSNVCRSFFILLIVKANRFNNALLACLKRTHICAKMKLKFIQYIIHRLYEERESNKTTLCVHYKKVHLVLIRIVAMHLNMDNILLLFTHAVPKYAYLTFCSLHITFCLKRRSFALP